MKIYLLLSMFILVSSLSSCSSNDDESIVITDPVKTQIPEELKGNWKINYYYYYSDPNSSFINNQGYYIKFNSDNTIEYKDFNTQFKGKAVLNNMDKTVINFEGSSNFIRVSNSSQHPGQNAFTIYYSSGSGNQNSILVGAKQ